MKKASIIIRTKNEERWIKACLDSLAEQDNQCFEIIIVDNMSTDNTLKLINKHPLFEKIKIVKIKDYIPGKSLNIGIRASVGDIIVCISAHCIPSNKNWLKDLIEPLSIKKKIVATYGRQVPMPYSSPEDVRDMLLVFSKDERVQKNDYFFHNAHSAFFKNIWKKHPFNEDLTNIEDRDFGKNLIDNGYLIYYNPIPTVYHYHGIHQTGNLKRLKGVISIMNSLDDKDELNTLPDVCSIENQSTVVFIPLIKEKISKSEQRNLREICSKLGGLKSVKNVVIISFESIHQYVDNIKKVLCFNRKRISNDLNLGVFELIRETCLIMDNSLEYDIGIYFNPKNKLDSKKLNLLEKRLINFPITGVDITFPATKDYGYYWYFENNKYNPTSFEKTLLMKENRNFLYKANYGMGSIFNIFSLKSGEILNKKILIDEV